ncbi:MAG TPA: carboxypeptidase-like regulatory domain-containing protein [Methanocorpusculum sp.]|nr:carboxypeptidase-like regulatory domain-containing protein [Methanocorpusculum sp.]
MYKRVLLILLAAVFLLIGAGAADTVVLTVVVQDASNNYAGLADASVELTDTGAAHIAQINTDSAGKVQFSVTAGNKYIVSVQKSGYVGQSKEITIASGESGALEFVYLSREIPLAVIVKATDGYLIPNAEIYIDNVLAGSTDASGYCQLSVTRGQPYAFSVTHPSYESFSDTISVGNEPSETIYLIKKDVAPYFFVTDTKGNRIEGASVTLSGTAAGVTNADGIVTLAPSAYSGAYPVTVTKEGFEVYNGDVVITASKTEYDIVLTPLAYSITVLVTSGNAPVARAAVYIDENLAAYSGEDGKANALGIYSEGTHVILVTADGFAPVQESVFVNALNTAFTIDMSRTTIPLTVLVKDGSVPLANIPVCIDGTVAGVTNDMGLFTASYDIGKTIKITAVKDGCTCEAVSYTLVNGENNVTVVLTPDVPVTVIAVAALAVIVVLLAVILIVTGVRKKKAAAKSQKKGKSGGNSGDKWDFI